MVNYVIVGIETLLYALVGGYILSLMVGLFKFEDKSFKTALIISSSVALLSLILKLFLEVSLLSKLIVFFVTAILALFLIDFKYDSKIKKNLLVWVSWQAALFVFMMIIGSLIGLFIALFS